MDKAKVLEIIEPSSDLDGKVAASSFDARKIRTDSLDDADDFPEKEVDYCLRIRSSKKCTKSFINKLNN